MNCHFKYTPQQFYLTCANVGFKALLILLDYSNNST